MSVPAEIVHHIFSFTNVATVISGRRVCKYYNKWLKPTYESMTRPPNIIFRNPEFIYDDEYINNLELIDSQGEPYKLDYTRCRIRGRRYMVYNKFTLLFKFDIINSKNCILFGYDGDDYIVYLFKQVQRGGTKLLYRSDRIVKDLNNLHQIVVNLVGYKASAISDQLLMPISCIYDIIGNLPSDTYQYQLRIMNKSYIPYIINPNIQLNFTDIPYKEMYVESPELLGQILSKRYHLCRLSNAFKVHDRILKRIYSNTTTYSEYKDEEFIITTDIKVRPNYVPCGLYIYRRLDINTEAGILAKYFHYLVDPSIDIITKILMYYASCGKPSNGINIVYYALEHNMMNEYIVFASHVIMYYHCRISKLPHEAEELSEQIVFVWLRFTEIINKDLWMTNWKWYTEELKSLLSTKMR